MGIVLGGRGNRVSEILVNDKNQPNSHQGPVCSGKEFRKFVVSWNFDMIRVFKFDTNEDLNIVEGGKMILHLESYGRYLENGVSIQSLSVSTRRGSTGSWKFKDQV